MSAGAPPTMAVRSRRFASPFGNQRALLEPIVQPLYSTYLLGAGATPRELLFYQYAVGATTAGNAAVLPIATQLQTNMVAAGSFPTPKVYLASGIRLVATELDATQIALITPSTASTVAGPTYTGQEVSDLDDLSKIIYGSYLRLFVGTKEYLTVPSFLAPANTGIQGESSLFALGGTTPSAPVSNQRVATFHGAGRYMSFNPYNILIPSQQNFNVSLNFPQGTTPTISVSRAIYAVMDGLLGREVQ